MAECGREALSHASSERPGLWFMLTAVLSVPSAALGTPWEPSSHMSDGWMMLVCLGPSEAH